MTTYKIEYIYIYIYLFGCLARAQKRLNLVKYPKSILRKKKLNTPQIYVKRLIC